MDPYLFKRLWRRPWLSLCSLVLSVTLCFLMGYLANYRQNQQEKLRQVKEDYDVLCVVTDRRGTRSDSLRMNDKVAQLLADTSETGLAQYVRELRITKEFLYTSPVLGVTDMFNPMVIGVSDPRCSPLLDPAEDAEVTYFVEDFYDQSEYVCLISEEKYQMLDRDTVKLFLEDPFIDPGLYISFDSDMVEMTIGGYYKGSGETIFISFNASQRLCDEMSAGLRSSDSVAFFAADNEKLPEIYEVSGKVFGTVDPNAGDRAFLQIAMTIYDGQYRATVTALEQNIARTDYLLPIVLLLGLGVGFLISFLFTRSERRTYALMRTLGMTRWRLFGSILREQLLLVAIAVLAATVLTREVIPGGGYFLCYSIGCAACIFRAICVPPTAILRDQE